MSKYVSRYHKLFDEVIKENLMKELALQNIMECPTLEKIVVNMGVGEATQNAKLMDAAMNDLAIITGQKPVERRAKKSEAGFKLRENQAIGAKVTLRRKDAYLVIYQLYQIRFQGKLIDLLILKSNFLFRQKNL